jgi:hypothetical protein
MDGKVMRGTIPVGQTQVVHLLILYLPEHGVVLMQVEVEAGENEISAAPKVLKYVDLHGEIVLLPKQQNENQALRSAYG